MKSWFRMQGKLVWAAAGYVAASACIGFFLGFPRALGPEIPVLAGGCYIGAQMGRRERWRNIAPAPEGIRLHMPDGSAVMCGVLRDRDHDHGGMVEWAAVPMEQLASLPVSMSIEFMPARTSVSIRAAVRL